MIPNRTPAGANLWLSKTQLEIFGCTSYFTEKRVGVAHGKNLCILQLNVGFSVVHGDFCWCTGLVQQEMEEAPAIKKPDNTTRCQVDVRQESQVYTPTCRMAEDCSFHVLLQPRHLTFADD